MKVDVEDVQDVGDVEQTKQTPQPTSPRLPMTACYLTASSENQSLTFPQQCSHTFEANRKDREMLALNDRLA